MKRWVWPPKGVWTRHHPVARAIAGEIGPDLLRLRTRTLERDICETFGVARCTAMHAIRIARANHFPRPTL